MAIRNKSGGKRQSVGKNGRKKKFNKSILPDMKVISREQWCASFPQTITERSGIVEQIFFENTGTEVCTTIRGCREIMKRLQESHIEETNNDIFYNFVVGGDGNVYEGRGWQFCPELKQEHSPFVDQSLYIGMCGIMNHSDQLRNMIKATAKLIKYGITVNFISDKYQRVYIK